MSSTSSHPDRSSKPLPPPPALKSASSHPSTPGTEHPHVRLVVDEDGGRIHDAAETIHGLDDVSPTESGQGSDPVSSTIHGGNKDDVEEESRGRTREKGNGRGKLRQRKNGAAAAADGKGDPEKPEAGGDAKGSADGSPADGDDDGKRPSKLDVLAHKLVDFLWSFVSWSIPALTKWSLFKPVLRSSLMTWTVFVLGMLVSPIERRLGNASFLVLIGSFIQPSELPLVGVIEREIFTVFLLLLGWAWAAIAIKIADAVRTVRPGPGEVVTQALIFSGTYLEAKPCIVCAIFLGFGAAFMLYLKSLGPSPFLFASILACIMLNISLAYAPLSPTPNYFLPSQVFYPLALKAAVNIVFSTIAWPKSTNSAFVEALLAVLRPLSEAARAQVHLLNEQSPLDPDFDFRAVHNLVAKAEAGLLPLGGNARLLAREVSFGLASGAELQKLESMTRLILNPLDGCAYYFSLLQSDIKGTRFPIVPAASRFTTPAASRDNSPAPSRPPSPSPARSRHPSRTPSRPRTPPHEGSSNASPHGSRRPSHAHNPLNHALHLLHLRHHHGGSHHSHSHHGHHTPRHLFHSLRHEASVPVGIWESLRFAALETRLHARGNGRYSEMCARLLGQTTGDLLNAEADGIDHLVTWLERLNGLRLGLLRQRFFGGPLRRQSDADEDVKTTKEVIERLKEQLDVFATKRLALVEPFRNSVDLDSDPATRIPYRYLFQAYLHQYWVRAFGQRLVEMLESVEAIEAKADRGRFYFPALPHVFSFEAWRHGNDSGPHEEHEGEPSEMSAGGSGGGWRPSTMAGENVDRWSTKRRDPEAMDPDNLVQILGARFSRWYHGLNRPTPVFVVKAGLMTVLVTLPSYFKSTALFAYEQKAIWVATMSQLTASKFRGEVAFGVASRLQATFVGCTLGMLAWYIAAGSGKPNPYALAVVAAFAFPILFLIRIYGPSAPIINIITTVSAGLTLGYSIKNSYNPTFGSIGTGWDIWWKRFVEVAIGTSVAYVMSLLPPTWTLRSYQRQAHAAVITELGELFCGVVAYAAEPHSPETEPVELRKSLLATRSKLRRLALHRVNVAYEFSLRGRWPRKRYETLAATQMELSKLLSSAVSILEHLGPAYSKALLRRTRFLDPAFLADAISVLSMCATALRTGEPLPQITPVLLERFLKDAGQRGFAFGSGWDADTGDNDAENEDDVNGDGLPKVITHETLRSEEYQTFSVGVSVAFGIVLRIDRLCLACKELVGESFSVPADVRRRYGGESFYQRI